MDDEGRPSAAVDPVKMRRRSKRKLLLAAALILAVMLVLGWWLPALLLLATFYLLNEVMFADHVFYDPGEDYRYRLGGESLDCTLDGSQLSIEPGVDVPDTLLLRIRVSADTSGRVLDPSVEFSASGELRRQYFERGVDGYRYLNLSAFRAHLARGESLAVSQRRCKLQHDTAELLAFANESVVDRRVLIVAPHADDAEIAAFGLYRQVPECTIVTVTAGETDAEQFAPWLASGEPAEAAARFKGRVRCLDGVAAAIWGGVPQERCIALGYGCMQLEAMRGEPESPVVSPFSALDDTRPFRAFNRVQLPTDGDGRASWNNLLRDLTAIVAEFRPEVIVTAHPLLDKHPDHIAATQAVWHAVSNSPEPHPRWLLYANHLQVSQHYPFGPAHSELGLPPQLGRDLALDSVFSVSLDRQAQRDKALALDLMHDLKRPVRVKKWLRKRLQKLLLARPVTPYGEDDFFRKAVRASEVFLVLEAGSFDRTMRGLED